MHRTFSLVALLALFTLLAPFTLSAAEGALAAAQASAPAPAPGPAAEVLRAWNYVGHKLIAMAEDFPEDKYDYRPTPEVRSFAEQLLHIAGSSYLFIHTARGKQTGPEDLSREQYKTKADIVAVFKQSVAEGAALIQQAGDAGMADPLKFPFGNTMISQYGFWLAQVEHAGEHYGTLVVYFRLNGIVPPASRPRPR
ncbi:MAG: DinB family protein [Terriglobia bacterium]